MTDRFRWILAAGLAANLSFAAAQSPAPSVTAPTIKIGVIGPFTGPSADFGVPMLNGVRLAAEEINSFGGYLGRKLELIVKDDQATPDVGVRASEDLVRDGVVATIGFCNTGVAMKAIDIYQRSRIPLIVPCATGTPITATYAAADSYIFRTSPKDAIQAPFMIDEVLKRGWSRVAVFADTTAYGEGGLRDVNAALDRKGLKATYVARFPTGVKDLSNELREARAAGANVVFSYTVGPENAVIALGRQSLGWKVPQVGAWPLSFPFFIEGARDAAEGALTVQSFIAEPSNERRSAFLNAYTKKFNTRKITVPMAAAQAYDATYLLGHALLSVTSGPLDGARVKVALEQPKRPYYGVVTTYDRAFENDKDALTANMLVVGMVRGGAVTFAYPEDAKRNFIVQRKQ